MSPRLVTFDVYTALFDVESSLLPAVRKVCGNGADHLRLVRAWRAKQLEGAQISNSLQRGRVPFRELTRRALVYTFAHDGLALSPAQVEELVGEWDCLRPWAEADRTLAELKARGHRLGLLSNGDEKMLRAVCRGVGVTFEHVFASDHAGVYKPHPAIYALPMRMLGIEASRVLHVAGGGNDVLGAKMAGLPCAWSNRTGEPLADPDTKPDYEMRDLSGLLDIL